MDHLRSNGPLEVRHVVFELCRSLIRQQKCPEMAFCVVFSSVITIMTPYH